MTKITLNIPDNELTFFMKLIEKFNYETVVNDVSVTEEMKVVLDEKLADNAEKLGQLFRSEINKLIQDFSLFKSVRGKGLLNAILINDTPDSETAWNFCVKMMENGLLAKPTHGNIIRFAPPLVMNEEQLHECIAVIRKTAEEFNK